MTKQRTSVTSKYKKNFEKHAHILKSPKLVWRLHNCVFPTLTPR